MSLIPRESGEAERERWPSYLAFVALWALGFCLLYERHYFNFSDPWSYPAFAFKWICLAALCGVLFWARRLRPVFILLLVVPSAIAAYYEAKYKIVIDRNAVGFLLETNLIESREFLTRSVALNAAVAIAFVGVSIYWARRLDRSALRTRRALWGAGAVLLCLVLAYVGVQSSKSLRRHRRDLRDAMSLKKTTPLSPLDNLRGYLVARFDLATREPVEDVSKLPSQDVDDDDKSVVLVIGESARADHFQLDGYARPTTPRLARERNLVNFPSCLSYYCSTRWSVPGMLTPSNLEDPENIRRGTFLDLFRKHGFLDVFMSLNQHYKNNDINTTRMLDHVTFRLFREYLHADYDNAKDGILLPHLKAMLDRPQPRKVLCVHTRGSHAAYANRYPQSFRLFRPDQPDEDESGTEKYNQALVNSYDNSILYTDFFLSSVIELLRNRNAVLVYSSDHGESLGEAGRYLHGRCGIKAERHVPFLVWASDEYIRRHPDRYRALKENAGKDISHDYIFHTMLGLAGLNSAVKRDEMDLTRPGVKEIVPFWKSPPSRKRRESAQTAQGVETPASASARGG